MEKLKTYSTTMWAAMPLLIAIPWLWTYLRPGLGVALTLMVFPFVWKARAGRGRSRFAWISLAGGLLHLLLGNNIFLLLGLGACLLYLIESQGKQVGWLPLLMICLISPVVGSWIDVFSFPLRLEMSQWVGEILTRLGAEVEVQGNRFYYDGQWFEVEAACVGISVFVLSLTLNLLILGLAEQWRDRPWTVWEIGMWSLLALGLAVGANMIRTVWLVLFHSPAETLGHELVGLLSVMMCVGVPLWTGMWARMGGKFWERPQKASASAHPQVSFQRLGFGLMTILALMSVYTLKKPDIPIPAHLADFEWAGMQKDFPTEGLVRLYDEETIIYLKAAVAPWRADHTPQICWRGSGYSFHHIQLHSAVSFPYITAIMTHESDTLYTAWGYHNGEIGVVDQLAWRWRALKGEAPFLLWNITTSSPAKRAAYLTDRSWLPKLRTSSTQQASN